MASTSGAAELAGAVLERCLLGQSWQCVEFDQLIARALDPETAHEAGRALFGVLVEGLADRFEAALCDAYVELFSEAVSRALPEVWAADLVARYQRVRQVRPFVGEASTIQHIFVLSRVTLGADIVVTSTVMDGLKQRFPNAQIHFVGPRKNYELFAADERVAHLALDYRRGGTLADRLLVWPDLQNQLQAANSIVVDPDSRYTQLGLLPVCADERYFFFESRAFGGEGDEPLTALTRRWVEYTFGVAEARAYIAPLEVTSAAEITVSLGVGENENKRVGDPFEAELLKLVQDVSLDRLRIDPARSQQAGQRAPRRLTVDVGAGGREAARVEKAIGAAGITAERWTGSFAGFASQIQQSRLYVGYDSAGQHAAAACGVPLLSVFAGFVSPRMFHRWHPAGAAPCAVIRVDDPEPNGVLAAVRERLASLPVLP